METSNHSSRERFGWQLNWKRLVLLLWSVAGIYVVFVVLNLGRPSRDYPDAYSELPRWIQLLQCDNMNAQERERAELALRVLSTFPRIGYMHIGALKYFGDIEHRGLSVPVCPPVDLYPAVTAITTDQRVFSAPYLYEDEVNLARALGPRNEQILNSVARTAFNSRPIPYANLLKKADVRPLARLALAEFGVAAKPWSEQAFGQIGHDDPLGTTAAQIAVATGHPQALQKVHEHLDAILRRFPTGRIPKFDRDRFNELAFALVFAGDDARAHIEPLAEMLSRPNSDYTCAILRQIGGTEAESALAKNAEQCGLIPPLPASLTPKRE